MANPKELKLTAERIRGVREGLGLSMQAFAELIDSRAVQGTVGNWEVGLNRPNRQRTKRIADLGHVSVDYLLGKTDNPETDLDKLMADAAEDSAIKRVYEDLGKVALAAAKDADSDKLSRIGALLEDAKNRIQELN